MKMKLPRYDKVCLKDKPSNISLEKYWVLMLDFFVFSLLMEGGVIELTLQHGQRLKGL